MFVHFWSVAGGSGENSGCRCTNIGPGGAGLPGKAVTRAFTYSAEGSASTLAVFVGKLRPTDDVHRFAYDGVDRASIAPLGSFRVTALSNQISLRLDDQRSPVALVSVEVGHWNFRFCLPAR